MPAAILYGIGLGLTFDEFGMWLHLGGPYWQWVSYDAIVTIAGLLALIAYGAQIRKFRPHHIATGIALLIALGTFGYMLHQSVRWFGNEMGPRLLELEEKRPAVMLSIAGR